MVINRMTLTKYEGTSFFVDDRVGGVLIEERPIPETWT